MGSRRVRSGHMARHKIVAHFQVVEEEVASKSHIHEASMREGEGNRAVPTPDSARCGSGVAPFDSCRRVL